jgi:hypothetical protein
MMMSIEITVFSSVIHFFQVCSLTMLSVSRLHSIDDKIINVYGGICGMRLGRRNEILVENQPQCYFFHHNSHMT